MRSFVLEHKRAPGDVLVMSALVRDIALAYPGQYRVAVDTSASELWQNNPHITTVDDTAEKIRLDYGPALEKVGNVRQHFLLGFHKNFEEQTGIHVPLLYPRPDYHLSDEEKEVPLVSGRYWVIISGGKSDFITKHWAYRRHQQVVNILRQAGIYTVQLGAMGHNEKMYHYHPRLENTLCLVGLTTLRDMARIIYHAEGVICPVTFVMHMAGALQKPCVVIAGGREEWWWEAYVPRLGLFGDEIREDVRIPHRFLHTIGRLSCCATRGCWLRTVDTGPKACLHQIEQRGQKVPACMDLISVNHVIEAVMSYYEDGTLPPVGQPKHISIINGVPKITKTAESADTQDNSSLAAALTLPEPQLLLETDAIRQISTK